jgi:hypothetical protein
MPLLRVTSTTPVSNQQDTIDSARVAPDNRADPITGRGRGMRASATREDNDERARSCDELRRSIGHRAFALGIARETTRGA